MLTAFTCQGGALRRCSEPLASAEWIDLLEPTQDEIERVSHETGLTIPSEAEINEIESSSRLATRDGVLYLTHADGQPAGDRAAIDLARLHPLA